MPRILFKRSVSVGSKVVSIKRFSTTANVFALSSVYRVTSMSAGLFPLTTTNASSGRTTPNVEKDTVCFTTERNSCRSSSRNSSLGKFTLYALSATTTAFPRNRVVVVVVVGGATAEPTLGSQRADRVSRVRTCSRLGRFSSAAVKFTEIILSLATIVRRTTSTSSLEGGSTPAMTFTFGTSYLSLMCSASIFT